MKTAKEMFEELGWKYIGTTTINVYTINEVQYVYKKNEEDVGVIIFNNIFKEVKVSRIKLPREVTPEFNISNKTLEAINKQVEELGWSKDEN